MSGLMAGKVVVMTGGAAGIGRATTIAFARRGANVVIGDIDGAEAEETVASIRGNGGDATCVPVDVSKPADVQHIGADDEAIDAEALRLLFAASAPRARVTLLPGINHFGIFSDSVALDQTKAWLNGS